MLAHHQSFDMNILDGRELIKHGEVPRLDSHGFSMVTQKTDHLQPQDFYDNEKVLQRYFPQVESLIRQNVPGAENPDTKVLIFDHALRSGGQKLRDVENVNPYASLVHCDATVRSGHARAKDQLLATVYINITCLPFAPHILPPCFRTRQK